MRIASISKPLIAAAWQQTPLEEFLESEFYTLWDNHCALLPPRLDDRVIQITARHLIDHLSGFTNGGNGFDPGFSGIPIID